MQCETQALPAAANVANVANMAHPLAAQATALIEATEHGLAELGQPLPSLAQLLPDSDGLQAIPPGVIVAWFETDSADRWDWGGALSEVLRVLLSGLLGGTVHQPPLAIADLDDDVWHPGYCGGQALQGLRNLRQIADKYELDVAVTGSVTVRDGEYSISASYLSLCSGEPLDQKLVTANCASSLADALLELACWCAQRLGVSTDHEQRQLLRDTVPNGPLLAYVELFTAWRQESDTRRAVALAKDLRGSGLAAAEVASLYLLPDRPRVPHLIEQSLNALTVRYHGHTELLVLTILTDAHSPLPSVQTVLAERMLGLLQHRSNDALLWRCCARQLARGGATGAGVRLMLELLRAYPTFYRAWWSLANALRDHAWRFRGEQYWHQVGASEQNLFCGLSDLASQAADVALTLHPNSPSLLDDRLRLENGFSETLWDLFQRAVRLAPQYAGAYANALNFAAPKWGGDIDFQLEIIARAIENNPQQKWPFQLYRDYLEDSDDYGLTTRIALLFYRRFHKTDWPRSVIGRIG